MGSLRLSTFSRVFFSGRNPSMPSLRRNEKIENIFSSVSPGDSIIPGRGGVAVSGLLSKDGWEGKKFGCHVTSDHFV